jgi:hypothetical protein
MKTPIHGYAAALLLSASMVAASTAAAAPAPAKGFDYPTVERVNFVEQCMQENPGPHYEMVAKCSCVLDHIAQTVRYDDFVSMETSTNATSIAGERGNAIRDSENLQKEIRTLRDLQAQAKKSCFIGVLPQVQ